jgi:hypothetical protein
MKALVYNGPQDVSVEEVPDPTIERILVADFAKLREGFHCLLSDGQSR